MYPEKEETCKPTDCGPWVKSRQGTLSPTGRSLWAWIHLLDLAHQKLRQVFDEPARKRLVAKVRQVHRFADVQAHRAGRGHDPGIKQPVGAGPAGDEDRIDGHVELPGQ